jgi:hypothetical protein
MSNVQETREPSDHNFNIGRAGLKVPDLEWRKHLAATNFLNFFEALWVLNGDKPPHCFYDSYGRFKPEQLKDGQEIVVPADAEKPLLVLRGEYIPKQIYYKELGLTALKGGEVTYDILTAPETLGKFTSEVAVQQGREDAMVRIGEKWINPGTYADIEGNREMRPKEVWDLIDEQYSQRLIQAMEQTVGLLT